MHEPSIRVAGDKHQGMVRQANEDDFYISQPGQNVDPAQIKTHGYLYIVADGVGGNRGGDRASELATTLIPRYYYASNEADVADKLRQAIGTTAREILNEASLDPKHGNMSCTVAAVVIVGNRLTVAHLGDTRAYLLRKEGLQLLTRDHTWVREQVDAGTLSEAEAKRHPNRNVITKSLGSPTLPEPTVHNVRLQEGDRLLLCTDGLSEVVNDAEKASVLRKQQKLGSAVTNLIQLANTRGGPDNIAVVIVQYGNGAAVMPVTAKKWFMPAILLFLAMTMGLFWYLSKPPTPTTTVATGPTAEASPTSPISPGSNAAPNNADPTSTLANSDSAENGDSGATDASAASGAPALPLVTESPGNVETGGSYTAESHEIIQPTPQATETPDTPTPIAPIPQIVGFPCGDQVREYGRGAKVVFTWSWDGDLAGEEYLEIRIQPAIIGNFTVFPDSENGDSWTKIISISEFTVEGKSDYRWQVVYMTKERGDPRRITQSSHGCFRLIESGPKAEKTPDPLD